MKDELKELVEQYKDCSSCMKTANYPEEWIADIRARKQKVFADYKTKAERLPKVNEISKEYSDKFDKEIGEVKIPYDGKLLTLEEAEALLVPEDNVAVEESPEIFVAKRKAIQKIKQSSVPTQPITVNGITYNGGVSSASSINGAVTLAKTLGEDVVYIWDINNIVIPHTQEEALNAAMQIAKSYRDAKIANYSLIGKINECDTKEKIQSIVSGM